MDNLKEFFKNNDVRIGKDFNINPPVYYSSLNEALYKYFQTFRDKKDTFHFVLDIQSWSRKSIAFDTANTIYNIVFAILGFHRFFELLLKDILRRINPYLAVKFIEKEEELFLFLNSKISADEIKTIEFNETIKRFRHAFKHYDKDSEVYLQLLKDYEFLVTSDNIATLGILTEWRNRIMHNGMTLPNLFAFEYLVSQRLLPLIDQIIKCEKKYTKEYQPYYFETNSGIKVIDKILAIKFQTEDFNNKDKSRDLAYNLLKIGHLKEMGRASFNHNYIARLNTVSSDEPDYENPISRVERFAETETSHKEFYSLNNCICCGAKTLVVYRKLIKSPSSEKNLISWFKCFNCDYSLKNNVGDPNFFELIDKPIFPTE